MTGINSGILVKKIFSVYGGNVILFTYCGNIRMEGWYVQYKYRDTDSGIA